MGLLWKIGVSRFERKAEPHHGSCGVSSKVLGYASYTGTGKRNGANYFRALSSYRYRGAPSSVPVPPDRLVYLSDARVQEISTRMLLISLPAMRFRQKPLPRFHGSIGGHQA
jgi:hypothetical protein